MCVVARNVRRIIDEEGIKQRAVAERAGISEKKLSAMICGRKIITADDIPMLCKALRVDANELYRDECDQQVV